MNSPRPGAARAASPTPTQLKDLKPHVITLDDGLLGADSTPDPRSAAKYSTVEADLDAIFTTHLPAFIASRNGATVPIVLYAHGGLVGVESGFATAQKQVGWWKKNDVYPIHFVWKSGPGTALWEAIGRWASGGRRGVIEESWDTAIEKAARTLGGPKIWLDMKLDAAASSGPGGGARKFVEKLGAWMGDNPDAVTVHAVGHSAGSIFHAHLIPVALAAGIPRFDTVSFLAPAIRMDTFKKQLIPVAGKIEKLAVFTMNLRAELDDTCMNVYRKSLLYLISASLESSRDTPILGLARDIGKDADIRTFLDSDGTERKVVYTRRGASDPDGSTATSHGGFDDDIPTMNSVLRRVTGRNSVAVPFPGDEKSGAERSKAAQSGAVAPSATARGTGRRSALCIGIDRYAREADRLSGAVADSSQWASALESAGFTVKRLENAAATRENILGSIFELITEAAPGDVLVVQYAGHGTVVPDISGDDADSTDEAICSVDFRKGRLILDDDLAALWDLVPDDVSLTIFFDSCHSGGANRGPLADDESLPRGVELSRDDVTKFRMARGLEAPRGRRVAFDLVRVAEVKPQSSPATHGPRREVLFAACTAREAAWETSGHGDFTSYVAPLLAANIGRVSNREFFDTITNGFNAYRQQPTFDAEAANADAPLLAATRLGDTAVAMLTGTPAARTSVSRNAAIAAILRGVADLLEATD